MIPLRFTVAALILALSACSPQVGGMMSVPAAHMRATSGGARAIISNARAMPGGGARAFFGNGDSADENAASSAPQEDLDVTDAPSTVDLHSPTMP
jgi:hypothetical protein